MAVRVKSVDATNTNLLLRDSMTSCKERIEAMRDSDHPQIVALRAKLQAQLEVFEAVEKSLRGRHEDLRLFTS